MTAWNAWRNNLNSDAQSVSINQDLTGLPDGYYTITADMCTQDGCITDQHVFANGTVSSASSPVMTQTGWDPYTWETLTTEKVLVIDGKLTIGAIGHGAEDTPDLHGGSNTDYRRGWFCISNFKLNYLGKATDEEIAAATEAKYAEVLAQIEAMHLAADKADAMSTYNNAKLENSLDSLTKAANKVIASEDKYKEVLAGSLKDLQKKLNDELAEGETPYSADAKALTKVPVDYMTNYLVSADATYTALDDITAVLRYYRDTLIPALQEAEKTKDALTNEKGKDVITSTIESVKKNLSTYKDNKEKYLDEQVAALKKAISVAETAEIEVKDGADVTAFITSPNIDDSNATGWTVKKIVGNTNAATGQQYDGGSGYYLDTWDGTAGATRCTWYQVLNVPNGKYTLKNIMRTSGSGAYIFASDKEPITTPTDDEDVLSLDPTATTAAAEAVIVPTNYTKYVNDSAPAEEDMENYTVVDGVYYRNYTDSYGELWMAAADKVMAQFGITGVVDGLSIWDAVVEKNNGEETCPEGINEEDWNTLKANSGQGRGWFNNSVQLEVKNHTLVIGVTCDNIFMNYPEEKKFTGTWLSADNFRLFLDQVGDNTGWDPTTGVTEIQVVPAAKAGIYNLAGQRVDNSYKGIVIKNGKKYLVK